MLKMNTTNRYDKYKDSGIEWIGEIPDSWSIGNLKRLTSLIKNGTSETQLDEPTEYMVTRIETISDGKINYNKVGYVNYFTNIENYKLLKNDILFSNINSLEMIGNIALYKGEKILYNGMNLLRISAKKTVNPIWLFYFFKSFYFSEKVKSLAKHAINQVSISVGRLSQIPIIIPLKNEQDAIAGYLDRKCRAIDETIEKQKSVIEKLKEYKQSIITQAVTKGLDKSAPMKDSGIEWIGQIPQHWEIKKGKRLLQLQNRPVIEGMEVVTCFRDGEVTLRKNRREDGFTFSDKEIGYQGIEIGDLVIHGMDGFAGAIGISDSCGKGSPVLNVCTAKNNDNLAYISFYLKVLASQNVFLALATGIRERSCDLRWNKIANLNFVIPTREEQKNIVEFLGKKCSEIDKTIEDKENLIEKLVEYKKSLIYECVTGKRRVI